MTKAKAALIASYNEQIRDLTEQAKRADERGADAERVRLLAQAGRLEDTVRNIALDRA